MWKESVLPLPGGRFHLESGFGSHVNPAGVPATLLCLNTEGDVIFSANLHGACLEDEAEDYRYRGEIEIGEQEAVPNLLYLMVVRQVLR